MIISHQSYFSAQSSVVSAKVSLEVHLCLTLSGILGLLSILTQIDLSLAILFLQVLLFGTLSTLFLLPVTWTTCLFKMIGKLILLLCVVAPAFGAPIKMTFPWRELTTSEKDLVWHCYRYHQAGRYVHPYAYAPCQFLTFDRPADYVYESPNERIFNMLRYWKHLEGETYKQLAHLAFEQINETHVMDCMLRDKGRNSSLCKILFDDTLNIYSLAEYSYERRQELADLRDLYQEEADRSRVEDCFNNHRGADHFIGCYLISWNVNSNESEEVKPEFHDYAKIWTELEKKEKLAKETGKEQSSWYDLKPEFEGQF